MAQEPETRDEPARVGIFVSHKGPDREAARTIKQVLEDEDPRIDVFVFEGTPAGDEWEVWIRDRLRASCILLLLYTDPTREWDWCLYETGLFTPLEEAEGTRRRVICLYRETKPDPLRALQSIQANEADLRENFLVPLFRETPEFLGIEPALNPRKSDDALARMSQRIIDAINFRDMDRSYLCTILRVTLDADLEPGQALSPDTRVESLSGPLWVFRMDRDSLTWEDVEAVACVSPMKGTSWVEELRHGLEEVFRGNLPEVMTSTFRRINSGTIYAPLIFRVDKVNGRVRRAYVALFPVLRPELVRGPDIIGDVFMLVHIANRFRYELVEPYLKSLKYSPDLDMRKETRKVRESMSVILEEADRHQMLDVGNVDRFFPEETDREAIRGMNEEWEALLMRFHELPAEPRREELVGLLEPLRGLNTRFLKIATRRYQELVCELSC